jgi:hypothetical protein
MWRSSGEGGSATIATANRVPMLEHAIYSRKGAPSILWRDTARPKTRATGMNHRGGHGPLWGDRDQITEPPGRPTATRGRDRLDRNHLHALTCRFDPEPCAASGGIPQNWRTTG